MLIFRDLSSLEIHKLPYEDEASYTRIIGNHVYGNQNGSYGSQGGAGIDVGYYPSSGTVGITTGNQIIGNVVNNCGVPGQQSSTQGHGIYVCDSGDIIQNNIVDNNSGDGITGWHAATNLTISNNLVFGNLDDGMCIGAGDSPGGVTLNNCVISNNISINNGNYGLQEFGAIGTNNVFLNNCVYGNSLASTSLKSGNVAQNMVTANAQFVNYQSDGSGNYHLTSGSPCVDHGTSNGVIDGF